MKGVVFWAEPPEKSIFGDPQAFRNILSKWDVDFYIVVDEHNFIPHWNDKKFESHRVSEYSEAMKIMVEKYPQCVTTFLTPNGDETLQDHIHQENEIYVVGMDSRKTELSADHKVRLPCGEIWAITTANIALYDRKVKIGS